ncbi:porin family protein [Bradyrhizobium sp. IC3123]|uniref:outer membrane protein n=1 Tax=Bradyrhizobium sp. IC3123 TaxID=2793803 RepID=UPI001CD28A05|nr:outer membrane beta-barrel protein [Bradyrhizobium sp. IC3123]MCA1394153.1 porin family protein [Bradyrhizobium sp. IC3123]
MKKLAFATAALMALFTGAASAADLAARPYTKAPAIAPIYDWSGFYVGINGGGGWAEKCWDIYNDAGFTVAPPFREGCHNASGATVGGQIGYRWQATNWVFGVEAQGNWADFTGSNSSLFYGNFTNRSKVDAFGLFTGQVGYSWNNVLWYVKGGAAVTRDKYEGVITSIDLVFDRANETRWGGVVGTGFEFGFAPNWSLALEYDHLFMGNRDITFSSSIVPGVTRGDTIRQDVDIVTARINYRFGGPIVAKY